MAYCTLAELQRFIPRYPIDADTSPSLTDSQEFIDTVSARIDGVLVAEGYITPITGAKSLLILRSICLAGTGWYVTRVMFPQTQTGIVGELRSEYEMMLSQLMSGVLTLPDAPKDAANEALSSAVLDATGDIEPFVTRGMQF
jgi:hypothetical protein